MKSLVMGKWENMTHGQLLVNCVTGNGKHALV